MAKLVYSAITSLDGYVEDADGGFDWAAPDVEVHGFVNDQEREVGTYLYGRRMYDTMRFWQDPPGLADEAAEFQDYAHVWQAAEKIVFSRTLSEPMTPRTTIRHNLDAGFVRRLKAEASRDISVGGATLAGEALRAGLVDEVHQLVTPVVVGGGRSWLPDGVRLDLELLAERRFTNGTVFLQYLIR
jgi:dihydrofolate reductase